MAESTNRKQGRFEPESGTKPKQGAPIDFNEIIKVIPTLTNQERTCLVEKILNQPNNVGQAQKDFLFGKAEKEVVNSTLTKSMPLDYPTPLAFALEQKNKAQRALLDARARLGGKNLPPGAPERLAFASALYNFKEEYKRQFPASAGYDAPYGQGVELTMERYLKIAQAESAASQVSEVGSNSQMPWQQPRDSGSRQ